MVSGSPAGGGTIATFALRRGSPADVGAILRLAHAVIDHGDVPEVSHADVEDQRHWLRANPDGAIVAEMDGDVVGFIIPRLNDLEVAAPYRRRGIGTALVEAGLELVRARGEPYLLLYVPEEGRPGRRFAEARGFTYRATLHWMERAAADPCPAPVATDGVRLRQFDPAVDDLASFVALMNDSFVDHPTVATWTVEDIAARHAQADFDVSQIVVGVGAGGELVAFAQTSIEQPEAGTLGEIRLIGVLPAWRGRGLGRALLRWGIRNVQARDVSLIGLTVVAANAPALHLYLEHGFRPTRAWPQWSRDA